VTRKPVLHIPEYQLPAGLWAEAGGLARSGELTPLYVERYAGPRQNPALSYHDFWELTYVFKGRGVMYTEPPHALTPYTACLLPPGMVHREAATDLMLDTLWVGLRGTRLSTLEPDRAYVVRHRDLEPWCQRLWERAEHPFGLIGPELDGLTQHLLGLFLRLQREERARTADRIDKAVETMNRDFARPLAMAELALDCGYSEGHFYRSFHQRTGKTPVQYLTEVRVRHARRWLEHTTLSVEKVAEMCGFRDPLYFSRVFRRVTGQSPTAARRRER